MNQNKPLSISLIVSTYNWPGALDLCLNSLLRQIIMPNEIIVADDGSTEQTAEVVKRYQSLFKIPVIHVWHPDEGFRLAEIRNKAIARSSCEYIIQIDGDIIVNPHFVKDHINLAEKGRFVCGSRVKLNPIVSQRLLDGQIDRITHAMTRFEPNAMRIGLMRRYYANHYYKLKNRYWLKGCNMAFWREDLIAVNGYDDKMTFWGAEDTDIAFRLMNHGIRKKAAKFGANQYHLYHKQAPINPENFEILKRTEKEKKIRCNSGLDKYLIKKENPLVSVIIPYYNSEKYIRQTLESVFKSTYSPIEVIVCDDGSSSESAEFARSLTEKYPETTYIRQPNRGPSTARNTAIRAARGEFILPLDSDDVISPDYIEQAIKVFQVDPEIKVVYCHACFFGARQGEFKLPEFDIHSLAKENMIFASAVFRKKDWEKAGGYASVIRFGWEDWDFWISLLKDGGRAVRLPIMGLYYRVRAEGRRKRFTKDQKRIVIGQLNQRHSDFFQRELGGPLRTSRSLSKAINLTSGLLKKIFG